METPTSTPQPSPSTLAGIPPRDVLQKMLDTLGLRAQVEGRLVNGSIFLNITTADPSRLIGKHGQTLHQLQFLLNRMLQRANPDLSRVVVDCDQYRGRQDEDLLKKVKESADKVRRWGELVRLGPFDAHDRRVIHQHFDRDPELEAISEHGDEAGRKKMLIRVRTNKPSA